MFGGIAVGETNEPKAQPTFLMEMMEEREALSEARAERDLAKVQALGRKVEARRRATSQALAEGFGKAVPEAEGAEVPNEARLALEPLLPLLGELRFYRRFLDEVSAIEEEEEEGTP